MELKYNTRIDGKDLHIPGHILEQLDKKGEIEVVIRQKSRSYPAGSKDSVQAESDREKARMKLAFDEYKARYPGDDVTLEDFRYIGILDVFPLDRTKDELIDAIEVKYNDL